MSFISIDYEKAIAQAAQLERAASLCERSLVSLSRAQGESESFWVGTSGAAMRTQLAASGKELRNTKNQLTSLAKTIRRVAEELRARDKALSDLVGHFM